MEFHYVVVYDSDTKTWGVVDDDSAYFPDGNVYNSDNEYYGWSLAGDSLESIAIDERCHTMLRTLASIWPEVDHGNY